MHVDPLYETRSTFVYVPRDEAFSAVKSLTFSGNTVYSALHAVVPALESVVSDPDLGFPHFPAIDSLFNVGVDLSGLSDKKSSLFNIVPRLIKSISETGKDVLLFESPQLVQSKYRKTSCIN